MANKKNTAAAVKTTVKNEPLAGTGEGVQLAAGSPAAEPVKQLPTHDANNPEIGTKVPAAEAGTINETPEAGKTPAVDETPEEEETQPEPVDELLQVASEELHQAMKPYVEAYPKEKRFFISSDGQVFLNANKQNAEDHQKFISENTALIIYNA